MILFQRLRTLFDPRSLQTRLFLALLAGMLLSALLALALGEWQRNQLLETVRTQRLAEHIAQRIEAAQTIAEGAVIENGGRARTDSHNELRADLPEELRPAEQRRWQRRQQRLENDPHALARPLPRELAQERRRPGPEHFAPTRPEREPSHQNARRGLLPIDAAELRQMPLISEPELAKELLTLLPGWQLLGKAEIPCRTHAACRQFFLRDANGQHWRLLMPPERSEFSPPPRPQAGLHLLLVAAVLLIVAIVCARYLTRPLQQLTAAAKQFGERFNENSEVLTLPTTSTSEVQAAYQAFASMQEKIRSQMRDRVVLLAAITHDLQTPLTRLKLRLEQLDEAQREGYARDINELQQLVQEGLALARAAGTSESAQTVDLIMLLEQLLSAYDPAAVQKNYDKQALLLRARPQGLHRALVNIIDNALRYAGSVEITIERVRSTLTGNGLPKKSAPERICINLRDHGSGVSEADLSRLCQPFVRGENSRSRRTGGSGLGLTIAQMLISQDGGELQISNHPDGGLLVQVFYPLTQ